MNGTQFRHYDDAIFLWPKQVSPLFNLQTVTWHDENIFYRRRIVYFAVIFKNTNNLVLGSPDTF